MYTFGCGIIQQNPIWFKKENFALCLKFVRSEAFFPIPLKEIAAAKVKLL